LLEVRAFPLEAPCFEESGGRRAVALPGPTLEQQAKLTLRERIHTTLFQRKGFLKGTLGSLAALPVVPAVAAVAVHWQRGRTPEDAWSRCGQVEKEGASEI
jgi:hypothetical protein